MRTRSISAIVTLALASLSCREAPLSPPAAGGVHPVPVTAAQTTGTISVTLNDLGTDFRSDGKGPYTSDVCGVQAWWGFMAPKGGRIARSDEAACSGIAPRAASLTLSVRHVSDNPHVDQGGGPGSGTFGLANVKWYADSSTIINAPKACFNVDPRTGKATGKGLRFDATGFPGSNDLLRQDLGGGVTRIYSAPYPANLAYCEDDSGISFWHVVVDLAVREL